MHIDIYICIIQVQIHNGNVSLNYNVFDFDLVECYSNQISTTQYINEKDEFQSCDIKQFPVDLRHTK